MEEKAWREVRYKIEDEILAELDEAGKTGTE